MELEEIEEYARKNEIEEILKKFDWRKFEDVVAEIFRRNNFLVKKNLKIKVGKRFEIDLVAVKPHLIFCVECKRWSSGRYKKTALKKSVEKNEERVKVLEKFLIKDQLFFKSLNIGEKFKLISLIVTLMEEDLIKESNTFIVPVSKLNSFLLEVETFL